MRRAFFLLMLLAGSLQTVFAQTQGVYRATPEKINNLVHTKLDIQLDFDRSYVIGKAWITLQPHFYPTDSLALDAKGMEIKKVELVSVNKTTPLKYKYDGMVMHVHLGKTFTRHDKYTVYIEYTGKPNELDAKGSTAITDARGMYFINPRGEEKDKPTQVWTQGETEASSVWFPTIDKPNQKTTQELTVTVPDKFVTLSNGQLVSQKKNSDGTRTDSYKMDKPHAPYLFFLGVGEFAVVKDSYKGKEVSYYVEKEYEPVARKIFGMTPEMMGYFSKILNYEYPWNKYAQMVARDYVSGAMENTTAVLHQESAQQDARELLDGNHWERVIAHELFHHWFGNLVTTESWSNLPLNEAFANYSEYLWDEYKYGKEEADKNAYGEMEGYLMQEGNEKKDLVRFNYQDKEDMFDAVSYNKGGRVLHMLRYVLGDSAFFNTLNLYLTQNAYKAAEAHHLRLAAEEVSGKDLNWFFNQWFFGSGHPDLKIDYVYDDAAKTVTVVVKQKQSKPFRMPVNIDVHEGGKKTTHKVWIANTEDRFTFKYNLRPDLVNFDSDKYLLAVKEDNKSAANYLYQYKHASNYADKREAVEFAAGIFANNDQSARAAATEIFKLALKDKYYGIRQFALSNIDPSDSFLKKELEQEILQIAKSDNNRPTKADALELLASYNKDEYKPIFETALKDSSYSVAGAALNALSYIDEALALAKAKELDRGKVKGKLEQAIIRQYIHTDDEEIFDKVVDRFKNMPLSQEKFDLLIQLGGTIMKTESTSIVKKAADMITAFRDSVPSQYGLSAPINGFLERLAADKAAKSATATDKNALKEQVEYLRAAAKGGF